MSERTEYMREYHRMYRARGPQERVPSEKPCNYRNAHRKVRTWRGVASEQACVDCGEQGAEWSYDGGSELEQSGYRMRSGREVWSVWSPRVTDYSPRCVPCHRVKDLVKG